MSFSLTPGLFLTHTHTQLTHTFIKHKRDTLDFLNLDQVHARCVYFAQDLDLFQ